MVGKWYMVEYPESGRVEYADSLERLAELVGLTPATAKTYVYRNLGVTPRQAIHPETKKVELVTFSAVDMAEPLPDPLKELITARV